MQLSRESKLVSAVLLILIPTIMYGDVTLLGIFTDNMARFGKQEQLEVQSSLVC